MIAEFCNRYRERGVSNPREMLALRDAPVDLDKWQLISFGKPPSTKVEALSQRDSVVIDLTRSIVGVARRLSRRKPLS